MRVNSYSLWDEDAQLLTNRRTGASNEGSEHDSKSTYKNVMSIKRIKHAPWAAA